MERFICSLFFSGYLCAITFAQQTATTVTVKGVIYEGTRDFCPSNLSAFAKSRNTFNVHMRDASKPGKDPYDQVAYSSRPSAHARLRLFRGTGIQREPETCYETTCDDQGAYTFGLQREGEYTLEVTSMRDQRSVQGPIGFWRNFSNFRIEVPRDTITFRGRITDNKGNPLSGVTVTALQGITQKKERWSDSAKWRHEAITTTDADGFYTMKDLRQAGVADMEDSHNNHMQSYLALVTTHYTISAQHNGWSGARRIILAAGKTRREQYAAYTALRTTEKQSQDLLLFWPTENDNLDHVDFKLEREGHIFGSVTDLQGNPINDCIIELFETNRHERMRSWGDDRQQSLPLPEAKTQHDGHFEIHGVPSGTYEMNICCNEMNLGIQTQRLIRISAGEVITNLNYQVPAPIFTSLSGIVRDAVTKRPIDGAWAYITITYSSITHQGSNHGIWKPASSNEPAGSFMIHTLSPGMAHVAVQAPNYVTECLKINVPAKPLITNLLLHSSRALICEAVVNTNSPYLRIHKSNQPCVSLFAWNTKDPSETVNVLSVSDGTNNTQIMKGFKPGTYHIRAELTYDIGRRARIETKTVSFFDNSAQNCSITFQGSAKMIVSVQLPPDEKWCRLHLEKWTAANTNEPISSRVWKMTNNALRGYLHFEKSGTYELPDLFPDDYVLVPVFQKGAAPYIRFTLRENETKKIVIDAQKKTTSIKNHTE